MRRPPSTIFEWDEAKRATNREKHGIDFGDAVEIFADDPAEFPARTVGDEARFGATGPHRGVLIP